MHAVLMTGMCTVRQLAFDGHAAARLGVADIPAGGVAQRMQQLGSDRLDMADYTCVGPDRFALLPGCPGAFARTHRTPGAASRSCPAPTW
ncbi:hypothetical protein [Massilia sp. 9I]|uniref:hypothetical protein n=1 Tax=Massilia sp. 9I TaxID=2653152 RepID=UPI0012F431CB|nr:hypothetical protein [Massilia sp. 9I]VXB93777.1 hypothetical protein MASSI9I_50717 [Massilia sp. 9I]